MSGRTTNTWLPRGCRSVGAPKLRGGTSNDNYDQTQPLHPQSAPSNSANVIDFARFVRNVASGAFAGELLPKICAWRLHNKKRGVELLSPPPQHRMVRADCSAKLALPRAAESSHSVPPSLAWNRCSEKAKYEKAVGSVGRSDVGGHCHRLQLL
jgi:hypothetical protein